MPPRRPIRKSLTKLGSYSRDSPIDIGSIGFDIGSRITDDCARWIVQEAEKLHLDDDEEHTIGTFIALIVRDAWNDELERRAAKPSPTIGE